MPKLNKQYYYTASKGRKVNCYHILLPKKVVEKAGIEENDELNIYEDFGKIVIVKKWHCTCMECGTEWDSGQTDGLWALCPKCHCGDVNFEENTYDN